MTRSDPLSRRRVVALLAWGGALAALPLGLPRAAWAGDDDADDDSGRGRGRGRSGEDDDDHSGPGGGDDDHDDDDDEDDRSGSGGGEDRGGSGGGPDLRDITVFYPDGWTERIRDGHYELIDQQSRLVVARPATSEDFARMFALR